MNFLPSNQAVPKGTFNLIRSGYHFIVVACCFATHRYSGESDLGCSVRKSHLEDN